MFCLKMGTEPVPETLYLNKLTQLMAPEDYIEFFEVVKDMLSSSDPEDVTVFRNVGHYDCDAA
jgi:hypothetical protein